MDYGESPRERVERLRQPARYAQFSNVMDGGYWSPTCTAR